MTWSNGTEKTTSECAKEPADKKLSPPETKTQPSPMSVPQRVSTPPTDTEATQVVVMKEKKKKPGREGGMGVLLGCLCFHFAH